ncbi:MAG: GIY-YIG nuclease family protein [Candidatus Omnitrophica bacterium]|nr:GIY-YIG nuclease family protein [Candidatus Omnitrophota bacterium]MBU4590851.1 GIY-YIG nuclease family protein [Candidatus Omnitrophota bacterium]
MHFVYILRSCKYTDKFYIGSTNNLDRRLNEHQNSNGKSYTYRYAPWKLESYVALRNKGLAQSFESYLKTHSGRAFLKKRLISNNKRLMCPAKPCTLSARRRRTIKNFIRQLNG